MNWLRLSVSRVSRPAWAPREDGFFDEVMDSVLPVLPVQRVRGPDVDGRPRQWGSREATSRFVGPPVGILHAEHSATSGC